MTSKLLCDRFYISRSKLYRVSIEDFGMGIMEYIRNERLMLAQKKLRDTASPIAQIAAEIGMPDTNYFIRIFRKKHALRRASTAKAFRASLSGSLDSDASNRENNRHQGVFPTAFSDMRTSKARYFCSAKTSKAS
ncbi:MAG: helix-turn-helix transcriptional regulator [Ruminococcaceae bacterium]|nr:helix-turn-helix transcriptional regulator [Oscillospiraceae bacterium]